MLHLNKYVEKVNFSKELKYLFQIPNGFSLNEEIELGVIISQKGKHIKENEAMEYVGGYCAALDMTATCRLVNINQFYKSNCNAFSHTNLRKKPEARVFHGK